MKPIRDPSKLGYRIETLYEGKWVSIINSEQLGFCRGWLHARADCSPRPWFRLLRNSDGEILHQLTARSDVSVGQVAGWPTAEQHEAAAARALAKAAAIRARNSLTQSKNQTTLHTS